MLTKNFYSYMRAKLQNVVAEFTIKNGEVITYKTDSDNPPFEVMNKWSASVNAKGVSFGTGNTPASMSDYALGSILGNTQISVSTPSAVSFSRGETFDEYSVSFGVTNITDEAITVSEVGLTAKTHPNFDNAYALVDRTVLDVPVTIPAHQTKHIAYTIRFNYGDAS